MLGESQIKLQNAKQSKNEDPTNINYHQVQKQKRDFGTDQQQQTIWFPNNKFTNSDSRDTYIPNSKNFINGHHE